MTLPYQDAALPHAERIADLLGRMTLDEKIAQLGCLWSTALVQDGQFDPAYAAAKMPHGIGQITRVGGGTGLLPHESATFMNAIQRVAIEQTRLGIPIFVHEEALAGLMQRDAPTFPQALALAATWEPALLERVASLIREQMLAVGARLALAPVLDVARDPRWGRVEETYGEDPVLAGALGAAYVRGLQTSDLRHGVVATGKHFLGYAMSEGGRNWGPVQLGPRELREVYAEPFAAAIRDAQLAGIMNSYASIDGIPCTGSPAILNDLLRDELGFNGTVVADYFSVGLLYTFHRVAATAGAAGALALAAGLDMELPASDCFGSGLKDEVVSGRLPMEVVDTAVRRVLALKLALGLFEQPYVDPEAVSAVFSNQQAHLVAREAAAKSLILLKNDGVLPLQPGLKTIAVVGPGADDQRLLQGDYHYAAHLELMYANNSSATNLAPSDTAALAPAGDGEALPSATGSFATGPFYTPHSTPLAGLRAALGSQVELRYARGCAVLGDDRSGFGEAVAAVTGADVAIVVVAGKSGLQRPATVGEANDATDLNLTGVQSELIATLAATGVPLVVVVLSGRVHTLTNVVAHANALLQFYPPGETGGLALADVLTGVVNPSGRLPVTMPRHVGQIPIHHAYRAGGDKPMFFNSYTDCEPSPLFCFGHGLSYTSFAYSNLTIQASSTTEPITISIDVCNSGGRAGDEIVQLYGRDDLASVARPDQLLLGFVRVPLAAGQTARVTFGLHPSRLAFYDAHMRFVVEPGSFRFSIGASAGDIRAEETVSLAGPLAPYRQREIVATRERIEYL